MNEQIRVANNFSDAAVSRGDGSKGFVREKRNKTARNLGSGEIPDAIFRKLRVSILRQLHPTIYLYIYIYCPAVVELLLPDLSGLGYVRHSEKQQEQRRW